MTNESRAPGRDRANQTPCTARGNYCAGERLASSDGQSIRLLLGGSSVRTRGGARRSARCRCAERREPWTGFKTRGDGSTNTRP
jgi:hypothetical protein